MLPKTTGLPQGHEAPGPTAPRLAALASTIIGEPVAPQRIVGEALAAGCRSIAYTYTEPTVFYELAYDTAVLARERGLKNVFITNGFISEAPLRELAAVLDAANVDLKFFDPESYRRVSRARLDPILAAIRLCRELGVWVEVTTLVIPGVNDGDDELRRIAGFLVGVGPEIPWHLSRFYPMYKMTERQVTSVETLRRAAEIGTAAGLRHVYLGNLAGAEGDCTYCHVCKTLLVGRRGYRVLENRIVGGRCPSCATPVDGVGMSHTVDPPGPRR